MTEYNHNDRFVFDFEEQHPNLLCSSCARGHIEINKSNIINAETSSSRASKDHDAWEPWWITSRFCTIGVCNNKQCEEPFIISGISSPEESNTHFTQYGPNYYERYKIQYMSPPPLFFEIPATCPNDVKQLIMESFMLFFINKGACVSAIRKSLEKLLDKLKIKKFQKTGPRKPISLHNRIEYFKKSNPEIGETLMAIKWIGNAGTHEDKIQNSDIESCYSIYKHALDEIYLKKTHAVRQLVKQINKKKKPVGNKRNH